jgi:acyl carrier protein
VAGDLFIGGAGLARGYWRRPDLTGEQFPFLPLNGDDPVRLFRTGDRARYRLNGAIEFLGRIDHHQVKIRGFRVELGEIESVLAQHPSVRETVVLAREDITEERHGTQNRISKIENLKSDNRLVAYVVASQAEASSANELRDFLKAKLPDYMVPSAFIFLESLPLTPNGKVDRRALPAPDQTHQVANAFAAPRTPVEEMLAGIWADVLQLERVGIHDNFFDLGGHSLLATQVISRACETFCIEIPLRALFEGPTVAALAVKITADSVLEKMTDLADVESLSEEEAQGLLDGMEEPTTSST